MTSRLGTGGWDPESAACHERVGDGAGVRDRPRQPIELGHNEGVAAAHGRKRLVETGASAIAPVRPRSV